MSWASLRSTLGEQRGSIAPLGIGLFIFSVAFSLTVVSAASIFLFQKRLTTLAESTAVFVASGQGESVNFLEKVGKQQFEELRLWNSFAPDQSTVIVSACALWRAPVVTVDIFAKTQVCSRASARAGVGSGD